MINDKLTSQKPERVVPTFEKKKKSQNGIFANNFSIKKTCVSPPPRHCLLGFPPPASEDSWSAASGLANSARSCKAVASPGESRSLLRGCFGDFNINPTQLCRINPGWRDYFFPIPGDKFRDFHRFFGDNSYIPGDSFINPRFLKDPYHFMPCFNNPGFHKPVINKDPGSLNNQNSMESKDGFVLLFFFVAGWWMLIYYVDTHVWIECTYVDIAQLM